MIQCSEEDTYSYSGGEGHGGHRDHIPKTMTEAHSSGDEKATI